MSRRFASARHSAAFVPVCGFADAPFKRDGRRRLGSVLSRPRCTDVAASGCGLILMGRDTALCGRNPPSGPVAKSPPSARDRNPCRSVTVQNTVQRRKNPMRLLLACAAGALALSACQRDPAPDAPAETVADEATATDAGAMAPAAAPSGSAPPAANDASATAAGDAGVD